MQAEPTHLEIQSALTDLTQLCQEEYGVSLESLLIDESGQGALRLQRVTGIALKRPFANRKLRDSASFSKTGAKNVWPWKNEDPDQVMTTGPEIVLLRKLRIAGPWSVDNGYAHDQTRGKEIPWEAFKSDVEHERGLYKVLALWVSDQLEGRSKRSVKQYLDAPETKRFEAGLDLAVLITDAAIMSPLSSLLGVPTVAVGVALIGIQFGYRAITDKNEGRIGDGYS